MSMYNIMNKGSNENAHKILKMISLTENDIPRYRDVSLWNNNTEIRVIARVGGANRQDYQEEINALKKNEYYIKNINDDFDSTYAYIFFKVPTEYIETVKNIKTDERTIKQKTDDAIKEFDKMTPEELENHPLTQILRQIESGEAPSGTIFRI